MIYKIMTTKLKSFTLYKKIIFVLFSLFLSFMTVKISIRDFYIRSVIVFCIFVLLYYHFVVPKLFKFNKLFLNNFNRKYNWKIKKTSIEHGVITSLLISSILLGIGSLVIIFFVGYYTYLYSKFSGTPQFWDYSYLVDMLPNKIYYVILLGICVYYLVNLFFLSYKNTHKIISKLLFLLTITFIFIITNIVIIFAGILLYYFVGVWILGGET